MFQGLEPDVPCRKGPKCGGGGGGGGGGDAKDFGQ